MTLFIAWWLLAVVVFGSALRWGGRPERLGMWMMAINYVATPLVGTISHPRLETGVLVVDTLLGAGLLILALRYTRWWLLLAAANQGLVILAHLTALSDPTIWTRAAIASRTGFGLIVLFALAVGIIEGRIAKSAGFADRARTPTHTA